MRPWFRRSPSGSQPGLLAFLIPAENPLDLQILGRTLLHAALIGAAAGLVGAAFFAGLEYTQRFLLEDLAGYITLRARGETFVAAHPGTVFRPWLLILLPALGAGLGGLLTILAPEARGGGGDQMIRAFHYQGGAVRPRVIWIKAIASILTLGTGGSGGREGPTMQIGAALGSWVARLLRVGIRERRILMVAGVAAGMSAVFRTPLGAALLAVEVLYRDDFESDALIPAVLASVMAYSAVISIYGESTLFAHLPRYRFTASQLPLYALLAVCVAFLAAGFAGLLAAVQRFSQKLSLPAWTHPAVGGLALGLLAVPVIYYVGGRLGTPGQGLGILGGGYGAAEIAIAGSSWLPGGWAGVKLLALLCGAKLLATSLTVGSGGSAGDFAPSLVLGGLFGGAFGRAAQLLLHDPGLDPGAFALVGMGTFYGGIAHVPVSSLILVSELAGSYDLLVPLMLAEGIAFVALRKRSLYHAQLPTKAHSPVHRESLLPELLGEVRVGQVMIHGRPFVRFSPKTPATEILENMPDSSWQDCFPVLDEDQTLVGLIPSDTVRLLASAKDGAAWSIAADVMQAPIAVRPEDDLRHAARILVESGLREIPVTDAAGRIVGFLDEQEVAKTYLDITARPQALKEEKSR